MMAIRISTDVTSKGSRNWLNRSRPTALAGPYNAPASTGVAAGSCRATAMATSRPMTTIAGKPTDMATRLAFCERSSAPAFSNMMTKTNSTMMAPA